MSYRFKMFFKQLKENENPLAFIESVKNDVANRSVDILKSELVPYLPSLDTVPEDASKIDTCWNKRASQLDQEWLQHVYDMNFVYWEKENLVGMCCGSWYSNLGMFDTEFYFQNSTDQDYEFDCWSDSISVFYQAKSDIAGMSLKDMHTKYLDYCDLEDVENDPEYYQKVALYDCIFNRLHLEEWCAMSNKSHSSFVSFRVSPILNYDLMKLAMVLDGWNPDRSNGLRYKYMREEGLINVDQENEEDRDI